MKLGLFEGPTGLLLGGVHGTDVVDLAPLLSGAAVLPFEREHTR